jgi:hypothetical protein
VDCSLLVRLHDMDVDCSLLVRLHDIHVDCCPVTNFGRFVIREFKEVESENLGIQLSSYTVTMFMRQLDGAETGPGIVFKEEAFKCLVFSLCVLHSIYVFDFSLFQHCTLYGGVLEI